MKWTEETMRYFSDAAAMSDYYEKIARLIAPQLPENAYVCDAGCGMGNLSLALLPYCAHITAIDRSENAVDSLRLLAEKNKKLTVFCGDVAAIPQETPYDTMVFCLFGDMGHTLSIAAKQCSGRVFLVKRDYDRHRFSAGNISLGEYTAEFSEKYLQEKDIPFTSQRFTASFGQPFRSLEDAQRFFALYNRSEKEQYTIEQVRQKLTAGPTEEFPYYLPHEKKLCLICFEAENIPGKEK